MLDIYLQILIKFQVVKLPAYRFAIFFFFFVGEMGMSAWVLDKWMTVCIR